MCMYVRGAAETALRVKALVANLGELSSIPELEIKNIIYSKVTL